MTSDPTTDRTTTDRTTTPRSTSPNRAGSAPLWVLLVVGVLVNFVASAFFANPYVSSVGGVLVLGALVGFALRARSAGKGRA
ncbi:MAG: hypothetical protein ACRYG2_11760 [Janthinobacterium lividum]